MKRRRIIANGLLAAITALTVPIRQARASNMAPLDAVDIIMLGTIVLGVVWVALFVYIVRRGNHE